MPRKNIFVRQDDLEQFEKVYSPDWFSKKLYETEHIEVPPIQIGEQVLGSGKAAIFAVCKHGADPEMCRFAKVQKNGKKYCK